MKRLKLDIQKFGANYSVTAQVVAQSITNNTSTIRITATSSTYGETRNYDWDAYINGSFSGQASGGLGTQYVYLPYNSSYSVSWDIVVTHNPDGTCGAINISCYHFVTYNTSGYSSTSITPARIPRASSITSFVGLEDNLQRTDNVEGDFKIEFTRYVSSFTDNLTVQYYDVDGGGTWTTLKTINNFASGGTFSFTNAELEDYLYNADTTTNNVKLRAYLTTYSGNTLIGTSSNVEFDAKLYDNAPTFNNFNIQDVNSITAQLTEGLNTGTLNQVKLVKGYSTIEVTIPATDKAEPNKGAEMSNYSISGLDELVPYSTSDISKEISNCSISDFSVTAKDSRSNETKKEKSVISVIEYEPIILQIHNCKVERQDNGTSGVAELTIVGKIWNDTFGNTPNSITSATYRFKATDSSGSYITGTTDITPTINQDGTFRFSDEIKSDNPDYSWNLEDSYYVQVEIADELSSYTIDLVLNSGKPNIALHKMGVSIGAPYDETLGGSLQVDGQKVDPNASGIPNGSEFQFDGSTVPDGYEQVDDPYVYSTNETKIGVWIDGKTIYRKCFLKTTSTNIGTGNTTISSSFSAGLDKILSMVGTVDLGGYYYSCISKDWNTLINGSGDLIMTGLGTARTFNKIIIVVEYTKSS